MKPRIVIKNLTPLLSELIQKWAFEKGWEWSSGGKIVQEVDNTVKQEMVLVPDGYIYYNPCGGLANAFDAQTDLAKIAEFIFDSPKVIMVGDHQVTFIDRDTIKVGCTTVTRSTIVEILAEMDKLEEPSHD